MGCYATESEQYNIEFIAGETYTLPIQYNDQDSAPVDLTGYGAALTFRDKAEVPLTTVSVLGDESGKLVFTLSREDTQDLYELSVRTYRVWLSKTDDSFAEVILEGSVRAED